MFGARKRHNVPAKNRKRRIVFAVLACLFLMTGCGTQKILQVATEPRALTPELAYAQGYEEGKRSCEESVLPFLNNQLQLLKRMNEFKAFVDGGFVVPPVVKEVFVPGEISSDGKTYTAPRTEWVIVGDIKFEPRSFQERLNAETATKHRLLVGIENSDSNCHTLKNKVEVKGRDLIKVLPFASGTQCAVVVELETPEHKPHYVQKYGAIELGTPPLKVAR